MRAGSAASNGCLGCDFFGEPELKQEAVPSPSCCTTRRSRTASRTAPRADLPHWVRLRSSKDGAGARDQRAWPVRRARGRRGERLSAAGAERVRVAGGERHGEHAVGAEGAKASSRLARSQRYESRRGPRARRVHGHRGGRSGEGAAGAASESFHLVCLPHK